MSDFLYQSATAAPTGEAQLIPTPLNSTADSQQQAHVNFKKVPGSSKQFHKRKVIINIVLKAEKCAEASQSSGAGHLLVQLHCCLKNGQKLPKLTHQLSL